MKKLLDYTYYLLLLICIFSASVLSWYYVTLKLNESQFQELSKTVRETGIAKNHINQKESMEEAEVGIIDANKSIIAGLTEMKKSNINLAGWITIDGTPIDFPVMYTPDKKEYYLRRDFEGSYSISGTPFIDERCSIKPQSDNLIVYGHNMKNGSMFAGLLAYQEEKYFIEHPTIKYYTDDVLEEFKIMAVIETQVYSKKEFDYYSLIDAADEKEFSNYISQVKVNSLYDTGVSANYGEKLILLSTCAYHADNGRFILIGKLSNN